MFGHDQVQVRIDHKYEEGYPLSADGQEIKEQLPLKEFLRRIFPDEKHVEIEVYRISRSMGGPDTRELDKACEIYNRMYIKLFRDRKTVLAQHTMRGIGHFGVDPYQDHQRQRAMAQQHDYEREQLLRGMSARYPTPNFGMLDGGPSPTEMLKRKEAEEKKKRDDDLFYLTT